MDKNLVRLRKMRLIATGLLILMAVTYFALKRFAPQSFAISCIIAFSEAAMIGALADWFAVVALFRHPMGMKWIPHTAIIQNNKERIGESLSGFIVNNFFTEETIRAKLEGVGLTEEISRYVSNNKAVIVKGIVRKLPAIAEFVTDNKELDALALKEVHTRLADFKLYPAVGSVLEVVVASGQHKPLVRELLSQLYRYVDENREKTMAFVEGLNKALTLPFISEIVYRNILKTLEKQMEDVEVNTDSETNRLLTYSLPGLVAQLKESPELIDKGEKLKSELMGSALFGNLLDKAIIGVKEAIAAYARNPENILEEKIGSLFDQLVEEVLEAEAVNKKLDTFLQNILVTTICTYRHEIGKLIRNTMDNWKVEDMVEKMEVQVGADLQYIRINGTVIGGLAGLAIYLVSQGIR
jgi:uncharacterized membrane-anchored protein YjiN (DUF445 family)